MTEEMKQVSDEPCTCVPCSECGGSGSVWFDFAERYLGNRRCDDLDNLEPCESCHSGIVEVCSRCELLEDLEHDQP